MERLTARGEPGHQIVQLRGMGKSDRRDRLTIAPRPSFDDETCRPDINRKFSGNRGIRVECGYAVFGFGPRHVVDQPGAWRHDRKILQGSVRHRLQVEQSIFQREWLLRGVVTTAHRQYGFAKVNLQPPPVFSRRASLLPVEQLVAIPFAATFDLSLEVRNLQHRGMDLRTCDEAARSPATLYQAGSSQRRKDLVRRHAGA